MVTVPKYMKRLHSVAEFRRLLSDAINNLGDLRDARQSGVSKEFRERIMLAVTEVNGCRYCSYFHSKQALEAGMTAAEVKQLANGDLDDVPPDQLPAVLFAPMAISTTYHPTSCLLCSSPSIMRRLSGFPKLNWSASSPRVMVRLTAGRSSGISA